MIRYAIPLALSSMALVSAAPALAQVQVASTGPVVKLSVTETVKAKPDLVNLSAGVTSKAPTAVEAMQINAQEMRKVIDRIKSLGIAEKDIQTSGVNLNADYHYNSKIRKQIFKGYQVSNQVSVTLRKVARTGPVLDALVAAGATDLSGPNFSVEDDSAAKAQARKAAMERGLSLAREYARGVGYGNVLLLEVSENIQTSRPVVMARSAAMDVAGASTPIQPGLVGTSVTISVTYEMVR